MPAACPCPRLLALAALLGAACAAEPPDPAPAAPADPTADWLPGQGPLVPVSGRAFLFGPAPELSFADATVSVLEAPELSGPVAEDGSFALEVPSGAPLSLVLEHPLLATVQTAALPVGDEGVSDVGFQVPSAGVVELMARAAQVVLDPERCQLVTTVSSAASPPYGGAGVGEPDAVVTLEPALPDDAAGPIYFAYLSDALILPDPELTATTVDGGVIFANLPTGAWTLRAEKAGVRFSAPVGRCHPGALVNAAPPHGVEAEG